MTDCAVSVTVNYAFNLAVATLLIAGLLTATGGMVEDQRREAARTELNVVGQRLASDLQTADRLIGVGGETVAVGSPLPEHVAGVSYTVTVGSSELVLETTHPDVTVRISFATTTTVEETPVSGGAVTIVRVDGGANDSLEVRP